MTYSEWDDESLPIEDVARYPLPGMAVPGSLAFSPDDRLVTCLYSPERSLVRGLYAFDPQEGDLRQLVEPPGSPTRDQDISLEEALRRERQRQRELGVTRYFWDEAQGRLLVPGQDGLYICDGPGDALRPLLRSQGAPIIDPQFSPDGLWVGYVQDGEVCVVPAAGGPVQQVTHGARGSGRTNGLAEYAAQEEMGRSSGFWWSPDSRWIAYEEVDETHIPVYRIMHQGKDALGEAAQEDHHYPFAGQPNARVRLGVVNLESGEMRWLDLGTDPDIYLARVHWFPDGRLAVQVLNRVQTVLEFYVYDVSSGERRLLLRETSENWVNLHDLFRPLKAPYQGRSGCFLWGSERDGFRHLYLYDGQGELLWQVTSGGWMVDTLAGVDQAAGMVYFTGTLDSPLECRLYAVPLGGGKPRCLTPEPGMHSVVLDHARRRFVDTWHALDRSPVVWLRSLEDGAMLVSIYAELDPRLMTALELEPPELVSLTNRVGTVLYGAIFRPPARYGDGPHPALVMVYGGPHAQMVTNGWNLTVAMRAQYLRSLGFLVFVLDNRGSARRGVAFEAAIRYDMGHLEVEDQQDGVRWLVAQGLADPERVGIYGGSYGGYMSLMCLLRAPETFQAAAAAAPVTSWDGYDTCYTERYMGTPQNNPAGYAASSVMTHVEELQGRLLLVHGLIDENVHFRHTARLINALITARKRYDLLLFPDERHMPRGEAGRVYLEERVRDFFFESLWPERLAH